VVICDVVNTQNIIGNGSKIKSTSISLLSLNSMAGTDTLENSFRSRWTLLSQYHMYKDDH
jgi:hypothetical protein